MHVGIILLNHLLLYIISIIICVLLAIIYCGTALSAWCFTIVLLALMYCVCSLPAYRCVHLKITMWNAIVYNYNKSYNYFYSFL